MLLSPGESAHCGERGFVECELYPVRLLLTRRQYYLLLPDLAGCVESQGEGIHQFEAMAIETLDSTSSGLSFLLKMQQDAARASKRRKNLLAGVSAAVFVVSVAHWIFSSMSEEDGYSGPDKH